MTASVKVMARLSQDSELLPVRVVLTSHRPAGPCHPVGMFATANSLAEVPGCFSQA
jgi:hypothetical protein